MEPINPNPIQTPPIVPHEPTLVEVAGHVPKRHPFLILIFVLILILITAALVYVFQPGAKPMIEKKPIPTPRVASPSALPVSQTGQSEEFKVLEEEVLILQNQLEGVSFTEPRLQLPLLEL